MGWNPRYLYFISQSGGKYLNQLLVSAIRQENIPSKKPSKKEERKWHWGIKKSSVFWTENALYYFFLLLEYKQAGVGMRVKAIRLSIVGWRLICCWRLDLFYTACAALHSFEKKLVFAVFIINTAIIHMYSLYYYCNCIVVVYHYNYPAYSRQLI